MIKRIVLIIVEMIVFCNAIFCQCTPGGVKIQTPACESPSNLRTTFINCSAMKMEWKGQRNQNYIIQVTNPDSINSKPSEIKVSNDSCDSFGNCSFTIPVIQGTTVNWNVQSICLLDSTLVYSYPVTGQKVSVPFCNVGFDRLNKNTSENIQIYPNPSTGYLNVGYTNDIIGTMQFSVFDVNGKMVFQKFAEKDMVSINAVLNLNQLATGSYFLKIAIGQSISQTKFVLIKN